MANKNLNDWNFQIHWNELEWVNPRHRIEQKNNNFLCLQKNLFKG